jgi:O104-antigen biosynthesis beta-1,3-galactosyltransferase
MLSVLMAIHARESPEFLSASLESIRLQSALPDEVLLVKDPLGPELNQVVKAYSSGLPIVEVELGSSAGLGDALRVGVEHCRGDIIARMDTDDVCVCDRFAKQVEFLRSHPEVDLVGSYIAEFDQDPMRPTSIRAVPESHRDISQLARWRCPVNHMTVMYRRDAVLKAGNYQKDRRQEDYKLWARMLINGSRFHNLQEVLVLARTGNGMIRRRGGFAFMKSELKLQSYFRQIGFTTLPQLIFNMVARVPVLLAPHSARRLMYQHVLRRGVPPKVKYL